MNYNKNVENRQLNIKFNKDFIPSIMAIITICFGISSYSGDLSNYIFIILFFMWVCLVLITRPNHLFKTIFSKEVIYFIFFLVFLFMSLIVSSSILSVLKLIGGFILTFSPLIIFKFYYLIGNEKIIKAMLIIIIITWMYFSIKSIQFYSLHKSAARYLARDSQAFGNIAIGGGYALAFGSSIFAVFLLGIILHKNYTTKNLKNLYFVLFVIAIILVFMTLSTITIIALLLGIAFAIFFRMILGKNLLLRSKSRDYIKISFIITLFLFGLLVFFNIEFVGNILIEFSNYGSNIFFRRIRDFGEILKINDFYDSLQNNFSRYRLLMNSISTFFNNPLFGVGYKYGYNFVLSHEYGIGNHNELFDILANYGLIGGIPLLLTYYNEVKNQIKRGRGYFSFAYIITFILMFIFNPFISFNSNLVLFFVIPAFIYLHNISLMKKQLAENKS